MNESHWPNVCRVSWLSGGIVAINNPGSLVQIGAGIDGVLLAQFQLVSYHSLIAALKKMGFSVVGITFFESTDDSKGLTTPQFFALSSLGVWRARETQQKWRQIAFHAAQGNQMLLSDVAARVAAGLQAGQMRVENLCRAYATQLRGRVRNRPLERYVRFGDTNSPAVFLALHALFWELAVLRDVLAEFASTHAFGFRRLMSMRGLIKQLRESPTGLQIATNLLAAADEESGGWLHRLTSYRNLFTHSAPIQEAAGIYSAIQEVVQLENGVEVPVLYYPLPADAHSLARRRSGGVLHESFQALLNDSKDRRPHRSVEPDGLDYLAGAFDDLVDLAERLLEYSPVTPRIVQLTEADLAGEIRIERAQER